MCGRVRRVRVTRVSVHCGVARVPVRCERPDRVSIRHGDRVSCVRCATGRTARGVVCSWSLESALPLVVWVAWCGACGAQMAVWVSTALCISRYTDQTSGDREGESLALVSSIAHRPGHRFPFRNRSLETRNAKGLVTVNPPIHSDTPCSLVVWFFSPRLRLNARARQLSWTPYSRTDTVP